MTEQKEEISLASFDHDIRCIVRYLKTDVWGVERLIAAAKKRAPEKELELRREIRPIAVQLLYAVIGTPKTFEEVLSEMEEHEDENSD